MVSNKGLNSKEALDESTATNSSVTLSGIRREKETPADLDIENYTPDPGDSDRQGSVQERLALGIRYKDMRKRFVFAVVIGPAVARSLSADENVRAAQPPHLTTLAGRGTTTYGA
jgi:hypothetical protein